MAFKSKDLSVLAYANGFSVWHYKTGDQLHEVVSGYFNPVHDLMRANDMIILNTGDMNCIMFVKSIENKNVKLG